MKKQDREESPNKPIILSALARITKTDQKLFVALNAILTIILSLAAVALVIR